MEQRLAIHKHQNQVTPFAWSPALLAPWWDDNGAFAIARRSVDKAFDGFLGNALPFAGKLAFPEISEDGKSFRVKMNVMPGVEPGDIDISTDRGMLTISADKAERKNGAESRYSFSQSLSLPEGIAVNKADISLENHVLKIEIPKSAGAAEKISSKNGSRKKLKRARR